MGRYLIVFSFLPLLVACRTGQPLTERPEPRTASPKPPKPRTLRRERWLAIRSVEGKEGARVDDVLVVARQDGAVAFLDTSWGATFPRATRFRIDGDRALRLTAYRKPTYIPGSGLSLEETLSDGGEAEGAMDLPEAAAKRLGAILLSEPEVLGVGVLRPEDQLSQPCRLRAKDYWKDRGLRLNLEFWEPGSEAPLTSGGGSADSPRAVRPVKSPRKLGAERCRVRAFAFEDKQSAKESLLLAYQDDALIGFALLAVGRSGLWGPEELSFAVNPERGLVFELCDSKDFRGLTESLKALGRARDEEGRIASGARELLAAARGEVLGQAELAPAAFQSRWVRLEGSGARLNLEFLNRGGALIGESARRFGLAAATVPRCGIDGRSWNRSFFDPPTCVARLYAVGGGQESERTAVFRGAEEIEDLYFLAERPAVVSSFHPVWDWELEIPAGCDRLLLKVFAVAEGRRDALIGTARYEKAPSGVFLCQKVDRLVLRTEPESPRPRPLGPSTGARRCAIRQARPSLFAPSHLTYIAFQERPIACGRVPTAPHGEVSLAFDIDGDRPLWLLFYDAPGGGGAADPERVYAGLDASRALEAYLELKPSELSGGGHLAGDETGFVALEFSDAAGALIGGAYGFQRYTLSVLDARVPETTKEGDRWDFSIFEDGGKPDPEIEVSVSDRWAAGRTERYSLKPFGMKRDTFTPRWNESRSFFAHDLSSLNLTIVDDDVVYDNQIGFIVMTDLEPGEKELKGDGCVIRTALKRD